MSASLAALLVWVGLVLGTSRAGAQDEGALHARVVVEHAPLRSGPGADFRILLLAARDDAFRVVGRGPVGHWLAVELGDGARAYVMGDAVWLFDASEEPDTRLQAGTRIFAPAPLPRARMELALLLGSLGGSGLFALRPVYMLGPSFGFELSLGASVGARGRLFLAGLGALVNLFPHWPVNPYFAAGGGGARAYPNADALALEAGARSLLYGGLGLRMAFKHHLVVRLEARDYALFDANRVTSQQELSGGLSAFF